MKHRRYDDFAEFWMLELERPEVYANYEDAKSREALTQLLVRRREELNLSPADIAERLRVPVYRVQEYESCGVDPRYSFHQRYARAVERRLRVLVGVSA